MINPVFWMGDDGEYFQSAAVFFVLYKIFENEIFFI